jgi:hypothetical protein
MPQNVTENWFRPTVWQNVVKMRIILNTGYVQIMPGKNSVSNNSPEARVIFPNLPFPLVPLHLILGLMMQLIVLMRSRQL